MEETDTNRTMTPRRPGRSDAGALPGSAIHPKPPDTGQSAQPTQARNASPNTPANELELPKAPDRYDLAMRKVGNVLDGKWRLDSLLGVGGMAAVYAATHRNGARAAIKLLPFSMASGPELCQRLLREGYLANKINHGAVVRVLDDHIDYNEEHAYIVMELLEGETTRQRVERAGPFEPLQAIALMIELCDCLRAAHRANVVHRDIKPENLFLTKDGLKVLDFGIARAMDGNSSITQTGTSLGTPAYMSPEQARGKQSELTPRSDLYSVGATLLFLLAGETMHDGESPMELMVRAAWTPPPRAKKRCSTLPNPIAEVIDRCCAFDPDDRYPDAEAVIAAFENVYKHLSSAPPPPSNPLLLSPPEPGRLFVPRIDHMAETIDAEAQVPSRPKLSQSIRWALLGTTALAAAVALLFGLSSDDAPAGAALQAQEHDRDTAPKAAAPVSAEQPSAPEKIKVEEKAATVAAKGSEEAPQAAEESQPSVSKKNLPSPQRAAAGSSSKVKGTPNAPRKGRGSKRPRPASPPPAAPKPPANAIDISYDNLNRD